MEFHKTFSHVNSGVMVQHPSCLKFSQEAMVPLLALQSFAYFLFLKHKADITFFNSLCRYLKKSF